jgi:hypothetical protein
MVHKFCFPDYEKWAKTLVEKHYLADGENGGFWDNAPSGFQADLYIGSQKSDDLMTPVREQWLKRISSEHKDDPAFSSKGFLDLAEELGDRQLQARVYSLNFAKNETRKLSLGKSCTFQRLYSDTSATPLPWILLFVELLSEQSTPSESY